jgi:hypothetical protein
LRRLAAAKEHPMNKIETAADVRPGQTLRDWRRTVIVGYEAFDTGGTERPCFRITRIMPDGSRRYVGIESARLLLGMEIIEAASDA